MADETLGTILLVEDESADVQLIRRAFSVAGVLNPIAHAANAQEAMAYLSGVGGSFPTPILILLDLGLPGMTGFQLMEWLRSRKALRRIPVVVLTNDPESRSINSAYDLGANSYLMKPGTIEGVQRVVDSLRDYWLSLNEPPRLALAKDRAS